MAKWCRTASRALAVVDCYLGACSDILERDDEHMRPQHVVDVQPARAAAFDAFAPRGRAMRAKKLRDA